MMKLIVSELVGANKLFLPMNLISMVGYGIGMVITMSLLVCYRLLIG